MRCSLGKKQSEFFDKGERKEWTFQKVRDKTFIWKVGEEITQEEAGKTDKHAV